MLMIEVTASDRGHRLRITHTRRRRRTTLSEDGCSNCTRSDHSFGLHCTSPSRNFQHLCDFAFISCVSNNGNTKLAQLRFENSRKVAKRWQQLNLIQHAPSSLLPSSPSYNFVISVARAAVVIKIGLIMRTLAHIIWVHAQISSQKLHF